MKTLYCDLCGNVIKSNEESYLFFIIKIEEGLKKSPTMLPSYHLSEVELEEVAEYIKKKCTEVINKELCANCKKVLDHFLELRKSEVEQVYDDITKSFELTEEGETKDEKEKDL